MPVPASHSPGQPITAADINALAALANANETAIAGVTGGASSAPSVTTVATAGSSQALTASGSAETTVYDLTLTSASCAFSLSGGAAGKRSVIEVYLHQDSTGGRAATWPTSVQWAAAVAPSLSIGPNLTDIVQIVTLDGGTTFLGALVGSSYTQSRTPNTPTSVATTAGNTAVTLTWLAPANAFPNVTGYKVYRGTATGAETLVATVGNVTLFADSGLTNGTVYYYKVSAVNSIGEGTLSSEVSATPAVPAAVLPTTQRFVADGVTTSASSTITSATAAFAATDVGRYIVGTGIPAFTRIGTVTNSTTATLLAASGSAATATATGSSVAFTIGLNPIAWFKADSLALADGAAVSSLADSTGNGYDAVQATGSLQPTFKTGILNTKPILRFAGGQKLVSTFHYGNTSAPTTNATPISVFVVWKAAGSGVIAAPLGGTTNGGIEVRATAAGTVDLLAEATQLYVSSAAVPTIASAFHVVSGVSAIRYSNGTQAEVLTVDGTVYTATSPAGAVFLSSTAALVIGGAPSAGDGFSGDIAEVLVYNADLTVTDRKAVEQYLGSKYSVTVAP